MNEATTHYFCQWCDGYVLPTHRCDRHLCDQCGKGKTTCCEVAESLTRLQQANNAEIERLQGEIARLEHGDKPAPKYRLVQSGDRYGVQRENGDVLLCGSQDNAQEMARTFRHGESEAYYTWTPLSWTPVEDKP